MSVDITNKSVRNVSIMEFAGVILVTGIAWGVLTNTVSALGQTTTNHAVVHKADISQIREEQKDLADDVSSIKSDIGIMKNNQIHYTEELNKSAEQRLLIIKNQSEIIRMMEK